MKILRIILPLLLISLLLVNCTGVIACSMCKVTIHGKTYLGSNEDSWRLGGKIWFEKGTGEKLGAVYVGYDDFFPQGGMNEAGLAFDGLTVAPKKKRLLRETQPIANLREFVKNLMRNSKTVEDVRRFATLYDRQHINGELLFADKSGNYLIMEPDTIIMGQDEKYIIANFCPSITPDSARLNWDRYRRGHGFISKPRNESGINYCLALVDTMHECRAKLGDGTMYSTIANLENGDFSLYFYHNYKQEITFSLKDELSKGDHFFEISKLFPVNNEFEKLLAFKTPQNSSWMRITLLFSGALFTFSMVFFGINSLKNRNWASSNGPVKLVLCALSIILIYYITVLFRNQAVFYLPAPYEDYTFSIHNIAAYIPFLLLILILPLLRINLKVARETSWSSSFKWIFTANSMAYLIMIALFSYWGLYNVF